MDVLFNISKKSSLFQKNHACHLQKNHACHSQESCSDISRCWLIVHSDSLFDQCMYTCFQVSVQSTLFTCTVGALGASKWAFSCMLAKMSLQYAFKIGSILTLGTRILAICIFLLRRWFQMYFFVPCQFVLLVTSIGTLVTRKRTFACVNTKMPFQFSLLISCKIAQMASMFTIRKCWLTKNDFYLNHCRLKCGDGFIGCRIGFCVV